MLSKKFIINDENKTFKIRLKDLCLNKDLFNSFTNETNIINKNIHLSYLLFRISIYHCLNNNIFIRIDEDLLRNCYDIIGTREVTARNRKNKDGSVKHKYTDIIKTVYDKHKNVFSNIKSNNEGYYLNSIKNNFQSILVNVRNHIIVNFFKYQEKYITFIINKFFDHITFNKDKFYNLKTYIFKSIYEEEEDEKKNNFFDKTTNNTRLNNIIDDLKNEIPVEIKDIISNCFKYKNKKKKNFDEKNIFKKLIESNTIFYSFKYYSTMITNIGDNKNFQLLPNLSLGKHFVAFSKTTIKEMIDKINEINNEKYKKNPKKIYEINNEDYLKNHYKYYYKYFDIKKFHKLGYYINLIWTDGYSAFINLSRNNVFELLNNIDKDILLIISRLTGNYNKTYRLNELKIFNTNKLKSYEFLKSRIKETQLLLIKISIDLVFELIELIQEHDICKIDFIKTNLNKLIKTKINIIKQDFEQNDNYKLYKLICSNKFKKHCEEHDMYKMYKNKQSKKSIKIKNVITDNTKNGLYDANNTSITKELFNTFNKISIDPGNRKMLNKLEINTKISHTTTKNYYNHLSGINANKILKDKILKKNADISEIYEQLSKTSLKTSNLNPILEYTKIITKNWDILWTYYTKPVFTKIKYKKYIKSKQAINIICDDLIKKYTKRNEKEDPIRARSAPRGPADKKENKKPIFLMGKGNGNITVTNTKNSSSVGPIKRIINELSKKSLVILVDEYKTSKLCNKCNNEIDHVYCLHYGKDKSFNYDKVKKEHLKNEAIKQINKNKKERKGETKKEIEVLKKKIRTYKYDKNKRKEEMLNLWSYSLVRCNNEACSKRSNLYNRDINACLNIYTVGERKLMKLDLGAFTRIKKPDEGICQVVFNNSCSPL
jgi:hypothetical protein